MKKLRSIGCLIVLILSVLNLKIALGQGEESLNNDQDVTLEVDGGFLTLMIPAEYQYQTVELTELERYPFSYTFMNEETGIRFTVYSTLHSQKEQSHFLKKLYDKSNRHIVFEDVLIGGYTYIVYTIEQATYAINHGEQDEILSSIACPIFDYNGNMIAAISLGAASYLIVPETINNLLPHLRRYANMISKRMGYQIDVNL